MEDFPVLLNVYDISQGLARQLSAAFLGTPIEAVYHTGIVVYGREYWFGNGVEEGVPGRTPFGFPMRSTKLGDTAIPEELFREFLQDIRPRFNALTYSLLHNNCNNFSEEVAQFLVGTGIPKEILELPQLILSSPGGALFVPILQNMENALRSGQMTNTPLSGAGPRAVSLNPAPTPRPVSTSSGVAGPVPAAQASVAPAGLHDSASSPKLSQGQTNSPAKASKSAKEALEVEIRKEFAVLMALGNLGANEAAAEALRRVKARHQGMTSAA